MLDRDDKKIERPLREKIERKEKSRNGCGVSGKGVESGQSPNFVLIPVKAVLGICLI